MRSGGGIFPGYSWFSSCPLSFLLLVVIVTLVESGPMADFGGAAGDAGGEVTLGTVISSRSLSEWSSSSSSSPTRSKRDTAIEPIQLCGYRLLEAVRGLCRGNYVGYNRRSDPDMELQADEPMTNLDETNLDATAEEKFEYNPESLSPKQKEKLKRGNKGTSSSSTLHRRYRRNIIDECCKKPCSVNDMLRYCGRN
ncbi:hypothetical protein Ocin01_09960 [Orchesella cincta]|uniref:Insulin-like domain-containing protein n=1 Tax=Orchesella cincta TaxID=48709 RepID=A0A1D2MV80_ORCCI|nr:hypothetical protein Ocin01_09960 [Orchesella cincta]